MQVSITSEDKRAVESKGIGRKLMDNLCQTYCSELGRKHFSSDDEVPEVDLLNKEKAPPYYSDNEREGASATGKVVPRPRSDRRERVNLVAP